MRLVALRLRRRAVVGLRGLRRAGGSSVRPLSARVLSCVLRLGHGGSIGRAPWPGKAEARGSTLRRRDLLPRRRRQPGRERRDVRQVLWSTRRAFVRDERTQTDHGHSSAVELERGALGDRFVEGYARRTEVVRELERVCGLGTNWQSMFSRS
jgi:hypothetical protein